MRRLFAGAVLTLAVVSLPHPGQAQASGIAFASFAGDAFFDGTAFYSGPWNTTPTGINIRYWVACIDLNDQTHKSRGFAIASVPNGSALADIRTLSTTAVVAFCASNDGLNITVPRGAVVLPAMQLGQ